jgi:hypothetical protein
MYENDPLPPFSGSPAPEALAPAPTTTLESRLRPDQLTDAARRGNAWLWQGYVGPGKITLFTSQWKSGKTTLLSILLARMAGDTLAGGTLAGLAVRAGRAVVLSEENPELWAYRCQKLGIGNHVSLLCNPFSSRPTPEQWRELTGGLLNLRRQEGLDLFVIDPLAVFLPTASENAAAGILNYLMTLRDLTAEGISVLVLHHPRKGLTFGGQAARGSGALPSHVDIIIEMNYFNRPEATDRRRWLRAYSRFTDTRPSLLIELTESGDDYLVHEAAQYEAARDVAHALDLTLEAAGEPLTQRQILDLWPDDFPRPDQTTVGRLLRRGVAEGRFCQEGGGRKNDPYLYWLAPA